MAVSSFNKMLKITKNSVFPEPYQPRVAQIFHMLNSSNIFDIPLEDLRIVADNKNIPTVSPHILKAHSSW